MRVGCSLGATLAQGRGPHGGGAARQGAHAPAQSRHRASPDRPVRPAPLGRGAASPLAGGWRSPGASLVIPSGTVVFWKREPPHPPELEPRAEPPADVGGHGLDALVGQALGDLVERLGEGQAAAEQAE
jgi:hypothetical protein